MRKGETDGFALFEGFELWEPRAYGRQKHYEIRKIYQKNHNTIKREKIYLKFTKYLGII